MTQPRQFEDKEAVRESVPMFVGLVGPSGSGKTKSALRLATGMQRVTGGSIGGIDTEADRMLHYADEYKFRHVHFAAPFDPLSYLAAVEHYAKKGVKIIIIDSASHMHEGPGGTLEQHAAELERLSRGDAAKAERVKMLAWQKPKKELRQFLNAILQLQINIIFCYRAKEKMKIVVGKEPIHLGFMPIAGDEMIYEATLNMLLYPASGGVPTWHPEEMGEKAIIKLPQQFKSLFEEKYKGQPLSEEIGQELALWASGRASPASGSSSGTGAGVASSSDSTAPGKLTFSETMELWRKRDEKTYFDIMGKNGFSNPSEIPASKTRAILDEVKTAIQERAAISKQ